MNPVRRLSLCVLLLSSLLAITPAAELRLKVNHSGSDASVELSGDPGDEYLLESARGSADQWKPVTSFILTDPSRLWKDATASTGNRFFRARSIPPFTGQYASNFRLIDQNNVSRELYYYYTLTNLKAIVLTFTEGNYSVFAPKIAALKTSFPNNVFFWTIETGVAATRSNILKQATAAGINWPVYHDPMQLITHDYDAHFNGETFVISREDLKVAYRGVIDDVTTNYVRAALNNLTTNPAQQVMTTRLEPTAGEINIRGKVAADYATVIAPLLQAKCITCHSPDNIAPFALTKYDDVVTHAGEMKEEVLAARMPPWHADPEFGKFHNDISLSLTEKAQLIDWIDAGQPRGTGADPLLNVPPAPPKWPAELGPPDQIVTIPVQQVPASGTLAYRYIYADATNSTDKWLRAAIVRPSNRRVVHHYIVWEGHSNFAQLSGIAGYAPGRTDRAFPEGTGVLLPANSPLTFNLHYTANGTNEVDQPELALWYAPTTPAKPMKTAAVLSGSFNPFFSTAIPAGAPEAQYTASQTFTSPVRLYSFSPHMHFRGLRMRFELTLPGVAGKQIICSIPKYDFDWQTIYALETPLDLPANSRIDVIGAFDNSAQNIYNPDPSKPVSWGEQSWDEMYIGYLEYSDR